MTASAPPVLLEDGFVLTLDDNDTRGRLSVAIEDGIIARVGARDELRARFRGAQRVSCRNRVVMPGLVNAHLHPELHVLKGALENVGLHDWARAEFYNRAVTFLGTDAGREMQRDATRAAIAECVLNGATCIGTYGVTIGSEQACDDALSEIGVRGTITVRDVSFAPRAPAPRHPYIYRLHAEEALYEPELQAAAAAHARGERIVMHAAETTHRVAIARERFGMTTVRLLGERGLLSPRTLLSHVVHVDDAEIDLMAQSGTCVVVSPAAEMKLGDGTPPVPAMLHSGITVALGTDAAVCNNGSDMFIEMRLLGLSQQLKYGAGAVTAEQILLMATRHGATALGAAGAVGCIREGAAADVILVDTSGARMQPLNTNGAHGNLAANLVYAATGSDVSDVMIGGRWIVRRRRLLTVDARRLWQRLARHAHSLDRTFRLMT